MSPYSDLPLVLVLWGGRAVDSANPYWPGEWSPTYAYWAAGQCWGLR